MDERQTTPAPVYFVNDTQLDDGISDIESSVPSDFTDDSMSTLASEEAIEYFQQLNGRMFPKDENMPIAIPTDAAEFKRLMLQHIQLKIFLGANYVGPVREILSPSMDGGEKKVLDLITAEGSWQVSLIQEMAKEFPHAHFTTVDNIPLFPHTQLPNVAFEVYDLYNGIAERADTFDLVHLRHAAMHLKNPKALIREIYRVLRPGGMFLFGNWELSAYDATDPSRPAFERLPGLTKALQMTRTALTHQGVDVQMCINMPRWLEPSSELWTTPEDPSSGLMFTEPMLGFRDIVYAPMLVPIGLWPAETRLQDVGKIGANGWTHIWRSMQAPFQVFGLSKEQAQAVVDAAIRDVYSPEVHVSVKYHVTYAFKRG
ncbi:methyltransferase domain protein [Rhizoctonia solani AG-3 Rhs1AP]|uniref:Methyltransferase domain protein n=2 Tax=Rhizoctonia solani AG-3 TaxID=1086053 RepID=A0A074RYR0_9AGAM|nr:methyltransferase domain protein [Rhizoctonia solani AG-3 Rhs1AP]KEP52221.1 methyltransferase domain protein [Rhizoctonia solani 123E]